MPQSMQQATMIPFEIFQNLCHSVLIIGCKDLAAQIKPLYLALQTAPWAPIPWQGFDFCRVGVVVESHNIDFLVQA